jgi:phage terminase small subunit
MVFGSRLFSNCSVPLTFMHTNEKQPARRTRPLTSKQSRFIAEYLLDLNGAAAAVRAGYRPNAADRQAYENLRKREIARAIAAAQAERLAANNISGARVLEELRRIGFVDPRSFFDADGDLKPVTDWTAEMAAAVSSLEVISRKARTTDGHTELLHKIRFNSKTRALEALCRHLGLLEPAPDDSGKDVPTFIFPPGTRIKIE